MAELRQRLEFAESKAGELQQQLTDAQLRAARAEERADAAERVANAKVDAAQADATAKEQVIADLREQVAWLRQPWWRKLVGR